MMKVKTQLWIIGVLMIELVIACSESSLSFSPTPTVFNYAPTPIVQKGFIWTFSCSQVQTVSKGPTWNGLTIGVTNYEEIQEELSPSLAYWDKDNGHIRYENEKYRAGSEDWSSFQACFLGGELSALGGKLSALRVYGNTGIPNRITDIVALLGEPDYVTWGVGYYERSLIWLSEGILLDYNLLIESKGRVIYFSPIKEKDFENSWLYNSLPTEGETYEKMIEFDTEFNDSVSLPPEMEVENPWGFGE